METLAIWIRTLLSYWKIVQKLEWKHHRPLSSKLSVSPSHVCLCLSSLNDNILEFRLWTGVFHIVIIDTDVITCLCSSSRQSKWLCIQNQFMHQLTWLSAITLSESMLTLCCCHLPLPPTLQPTVFSLFQLHFSGSQIINKKKINYIFSKLYCTIVQCGGAGK